MRVMLVSPNQEFLPDPVSPLGVAYLAASLREVGHQVRILDLCFAEDVEASIREGLQGFSPEIIGLSIRNVDNTAFPLTISYMEPLRKVVDQLRSFSDAPILVGGSGFTIMPQEVL
ncbi:MAG: cobalamin B12-binding domain-containing protein, partial [candidate division NC10 bacterium]|nr:cobalamin B12-binding domain-containing protein [candidate division NC10 bacterium]